MGFLPQFKIAQKLPMALVLSAVIVSSGVGFASYFIADQAMVENTRARLKNAAEERADELHTYFQSIEKDLKSRAGDDTAIAIRDFSINWGQIKDGVPSEVLRKAYIDDNPNPAGEKINLDAAEGRLNYNFTHGKLHPGYRNLVQSRGYYDLFLFDKDGNCVYSAFKEDDFATNFSEGGGPWADTALGSTFRAALAAEEPGVVEFSDFERYGPSADAPALFMATAVFDNRGKKQGVIAFQLPIDQVNGILQATRGVGETGDAFLVGADGLLRSDAAHSVESDILTTRFDAEIVTTAIDGTTKFGIGSDEDGTPAYMAAAQIEFDGNVWAVVAEEPRLEADAATTSIRNAMLLVALGLLAAVTVGGFFFARGITKPISRLTETMDGLAAGNLDLEVDGGQRSDEIGAMARAVEIFRENGLKVAEMTEAEAAQIVRTQAERAAMMQELQRAFGVVVDAAVAGDFSKQVDAEFPDEELNGLARSVNNLVATVNRGVGETGEVLAALANTDLTQRMEGDYEGAFAKLKQDTNAVADKLSEVVTQLRDTSRTLKTATGEILSGANDLSERTTKQAATIEETSASMEQLAATVLANADRAKEASTAASSVTQTAEEGGAVMSQATQAMARITDSSSKISNIIGMIDDIAFQTNLLALNASVEAARAGDAGKGFAVVAVEVRRLAQSAASASADVKVLIEQSASEVQGGSRLVADAAAKLETMLGAARSSNELMNGIAKESREQASSIDEVNTAVRTMDEMTQHNAALVEEINAAIEQTEAQATELDRIVDIFAIDETSARTKHAPAPMAQPAAPKGFAEGARGLQNKLKSVAKSYLSNGNAAVDRDWNEF